MPEQILIAEAAEQQACREFRDAITNFFASADTNEHDREAALDRLHEARGVLVIEFSYPLEALCNLVDATI